MAGFLKPYPPFLSLEGDGLNWILADYLRYDANDGTSWRLFPSSVVGYIGLDIRNEAQKAQIQIADL